MAKIFISYSRQDKKNATQFYEYLEARYRRQVFYDLDMRVGEDWWQKLLQEIQACDVFVYLISNNSLDSYHCRAEFLEAMRLGKRIIPVVIQRNPKWELAPQSIAFVIQRLQYTEIFGRIHSGNDTDLIASLNDNYTEQPQPESQRQAYQSIINERDLSGENVNLGGTQNITVNYVFNSPQPIPQPMPEYTSGAYPTQASPEKTGQAWWQTPTFAAGMFVLAAAVIAGVFGLWQGIFANNGADRASPVPTQVVVDGTLSPNDILALTYEADRAIETATAFANEQATAQAETVTAEFLAPTQTAQAEATTTADAIAFMATLSAAGTATRAHELWLMTPATNTPTPIPTLSPEQIASTPVARNTDWEPVERTFDGVEMVLVPAGCFMMGSDNGGSDEQPVHEQCFDKPFWIDKYEITRTEYQACVDVGACEARGTNQYSDQPDQPINYVSWFDARDFCEGRGGFLPTEAQWEYAARGPDNLIYPWGNEWNASNANFSDTAPDETFPVGSFPGGVSWVGAHDMSGNVWEWVSSMYMDYPYDEAPESNTYTNSSRVLRGGSFGDSTFLLRAAFRINNTPGLSVNHGGFRCARLN